MVDRLPQTLLQQIEDDELRRELLERELSSMIEKLSDGLYRPRTAKVKKPRDFADVAAETLEKCFRHRKVIHGN